MRATTLPEPFRRLEGRRLRGPVPAHFEGFYRAHLRYSCGDRLKSLDLRARYRAWAEDRGAPVMGYRAIKRAMINIGHSPLHSNGIHYCDVTLVTAGQHADDFPEIAASAGYGAALGNRLDAIIRELSSICAEVTGARASN
jgi:hypothetical protein